MRIHSNSPMSIRRRIWPSRAVAVLFFGVALHLTGVLITPSVEPGERLVPLLTGAIQALGSALAISMIAALVLDRLTQEALLANVRQAVDRIGASSEVLEGAQNLGVAGIFSRRGAGEEPRRFDRSLRSRLETQLRTKRGMVKILCVAGPDWFRAGSNMHDFLFRFLSEADNRCQFNILLLDPDCQAAQMRAKHENGHPTIEDIHTSSSYLSKLAARFPEKVFLRYYSCPPAAFVIATDSSLYMEPYPTCEVEFTQGPLGGKTPIFLFHNDSEAFKRWSGHFDELWSAAKTPTPRLLGSAEGDGRRDA